MIKRRLIALFSCFFIAAFAYPPAMLAQKLSFYPGSALGTFPLVQPDSTPIILNQPAIIEDERFLMPRQPGTIIGPPLLFPGEGGSALGYGTDMFIPTW